MDTRRLKWVGTFALMVTFTFAMAACNLVDDIDVVEIEEVEDLSEIEVAYGTTYEVLVDEYLENELKITFTDGETATVSIAWENNEDYEPDEKGTYTFEGTATVDYKGKSFSTDIEQDVVVKEVNDADSVESSVTATDNEDGTYDITLDAQDGDQV